MACAGFFYTGDKDYVKCFCCGIEIGDWNVGDNVIDVHKRYSPACQFTATPNIFYSKIDQEIYQAEILRRQRSIHTESIGDRASNYKRVDSNSGDDDNENDNENNKFNDVIAINKHELVCVTIRKEVRIVQTTVIVNHCALAYADISTDDVAVCATFTK